MKLNYSNLFVLLMLVFTISCQDARTGRDFDFSVLGNGDDTSENPIGDGSETKTPVRPDKALRIASFCGCRGATPILLGDGCASTCQANTTTANELLDILYLDIIVDPDISLNSAFGDFQGWCNNSVPNNDAQAQAICNLKVESTRTGNSFNLSSNFTINGNKAQIDISNATGLRSEENYRISIIETISGAGSANSIQLKKQIPVTNPFATMNHVEITPVNQYSCLIYPTIIPLPNGQFSLIGAGRAFFYYTSQFFYTPLPIGTQTGVCFDYQLENAPINQDRQEYARLETVPGAFSLWSSGDVRFRRNWSWKPDEQQTEGKRDIVDLIEYEVYKQTLNLNVNLANLFRPLNGFETPSSALGLDQQNNGSSNQANASDREFGFYLSPLSRDSITTYCPDNNDYNATINANPVDIALSRIIGVETEPLYSAIIAQTESTTDSNGNQVNLPETLIYITRAQLEQISFYIDSDDVPREPQEVDYENKTIFFHWPATTSTQPGARFVKDPSQRLYRIERPVRDGDTGVVPKDGKIGCVPKSL